MLGGDRLHFCLPPLVCLVNNPEWSNNTRVDAMQHACHLFSPSPGMRSQ